MKKPYQTLVLLALSIFVLGACAHRDSSSTSDRVNEKSSSTRVKKTRSSEKESVTRTSESSAKKEVLQSDLLTDQEIDSIQTIGDLKLAYEHLVEGYKKNAEIIRDMLPPLSKVGFDSTVNPVIEDLETSNKEAAESLDKLGPETTPLPAEFLEEMKKELKSVRDDINQAFEETYQEVLKESQNKE